MVNLPFQLRAIARRDMPALLAVERASFSCPWGEADFDGALRRKGAFGLIAECDGEMLGCLIAEVNFGAVHLWNLCVAPQARRRGIAKSLVRAAMRGRQRLLALVGERNVRAQLFFRSQGFRVVSIVHNYWPASGDDAYLFEYCAGRQRGALARSNRIAAYLRRS